MIDKTANFTNSGRVTVHVREGPKMPRAVSELTTICGITIGLDWVATSAEISCKTCKKILRKRSQGLLFYLDGSVTDDLGHGRQVFLPEAKMVSRRQEKLF